MASVVLQIPSGSGLVEAFAQAAVLGGTLVLVLMFVALGTYAYKNLRGDGLEWPDDEARRDSDTVQHSDEEDEWKY